MRADMSCMADCWLLLKLREMIISAKRASGQASQNTFALQIGRVRAITVIQTWCLSPQPGKLCHSKDLLPITKNVNPTTGALHLAESFMFLFTNFINQFLQYQSHRRIVIQHLEYKSKYLYSDRLSSIGRNWCSVRGLESCGRLIVSMIPFMRGCWDFKPSAKTTN